MKVLVAVVTVILAAVTLAAGLRAAHLWQVASRAAGDDAVVGGTPTIGPLAARAIVRAINDSAFMNSHAAKWTVWSVVAGAVTTVWGAVAPLILS